MLANRIKQHSLQDFSEPLKNNSALYFLSGRQDLQHLVLLFHGILEGLTLRENHS
jgi:hypothetical protein